MRIDLLQRLGVSTADVPLYPLWAVAQRVQNRNDDGQESNLLSLSYGNIIRKAIDEVGGLRPESYDTYNIIEAGDTVLRLTDLQNDQKSIRTGIATERGIITSAYVTVRPDLPRVNPRFLAAILRAYDNKKVFYEMGAGVRQTLKFDELAHLPIPIPSLEDQRRIADYLDCETAEIDAMNAELDHLVETLRERLQSLLLALGHRLADPRSRTRMGLLLRKEARPVQADDGVITAFRDGEVTLRSNRREDGFTISFTEAGYQGVEPGDFVFHGLDGFAGAVGVSDARGKASPVYHVCSTTSLTSPQFMAWAVRAMAASGLLEAYAWSVRQRSVDYRNWMTFAGLPVSFVPIYEQRRIVAELDEQTTRIDDMIADAQRLKALLAERRSTLITEVVTGRKEVPAA